LKEQKDRKVSTEHLHVLSLSVWKNLRRLEILKHIWELM